LHEKIQSWLLEKSVCFGLGLYFGFEKKISLGLGNDLEKILIFVLKKSYVYITELRTTQN